MFYYDGSHFTAIIPIVVGALVSLTCTSWNWIEQVTQSLFEFRYAEKGRANFTQRTQRSRDRCVIRCEHLEKYIEFYFTQSAIKILVS